MSGKGLYVGLEILLTEENNHGKGLDRYKHRDRLKLENLSFFACPPWFKLTTFLPLTNPCRHTARPGSWGAGAIAQLGERYNGIVEVGGSTPPGSTTPQAP